MRGIRLFVLAAVAAIRVFAQGQEAYPAFEVVSVKPHPPSDQVGTIMQERQGAILYRRVNLMAVIRRAYGVEMLQIVGPAWLRTERYDIEAKLPAGATEAQLPQMLQRLLAERFHFESHHEQRELSTYTMNPAKSGFKMRRSEGGQLGYGPSRDASGYHLRGKITLPILASVLSDMLGYPVSNRIEGEGLYDLELSFDDEGKGPGPEALGALESAIRDQLGIRLEPAKAMFDMVVVDRLEKVPEAN